MMTVMTGVHCAVEVCSRGVLTVKVGTARVLPVNAMAFTSVLVALAITRAKTGEYNLCKHPHTTYSTMWLRDERASKLGLYLNAALRNASR